MALVLASKSPRRRALMALVAPCFEMDDARVDEGGVRADTPAGLALALAAAKARQAAARRPGDTVIGCDTVVEAGGQTLGKPKDAADAERMLLLLSGGRHEVHTGVCVIAPQGESRQFVETTAVFFDAVPPDEMVAYLLTTEPYDKAGAYGIQGWAARFVSRIEGCYYNVMGLPVAALYRCLTQAGLQPAGF